MIYFHSHDGKEADFNDGLPWLFIRNYADGSSASGPFPLPVRSPDEQALQPQEGSAKA